MGGRPHQPESGTGDYAQRAFAPHHQAAEVVAGVVLRQAAQLADHCPGPKHRLQPRHLGAHRPVQPALAPAALVATMPPMVAESREPRSTPNSHWVPVSRDCRAPRVTPAPTVTCPDDSSMPPIESRRRSDRRTPPPAGTEPPTSPVFPPCGTNGTEWVSHHDTTAATSAPSPGRTTAAARAWKRPVQSVS